MWSRSRPGAESSRDWNEHRRDHACLNMRELWTRDNRHDYSVVYDCGFIANRGAMFARPGRLRRRRMKSRLWRVHIAPAVQRASLLRKIGRWQPRRQAHAGCRRGHARAASRRGPPLLSSAHEGKAYAVLVSSFRSKNAARHWVAAAGKQNLGGLERRRHHLQP